jgi:hypothetical protein
MGILKAVDLIYLARQALDGSEGAAKMLKRESGLDPSDALKAGQEMMAKGELVDDVAKAADDFSYRGSHIAPDADYGAPLHDLTGIIPEDVYGPQGINYYGIGNPKIDKEAFDVLRKARGNPDMEVPIYRAVPEGVKDINAGDWVTTSREYAKMHGESALDGKYDILEGTAPAKKLQTEGYPYEFGLLPALAAVGLGSGALGMMSPEEKLFAAPAQRQSEMRAIGGNDTAAQAATRNAAQTLGELLLSGDSPEITSTRGAGETMMKIANNQPIGIMDALEVAGQVDPMQVPALIKALYNYSRQQ